MKKTTLKKVTLKNSLLLIPIISFCIVTNCKGQNWIYNSFTNTGGTGYVGSTNANDVKFGANNTQFMDLQNTTGYLGIGTNFSPSHLVDIYGGDINIGSLTNNNGYRLGGHMFLWHGGDTTSLFCGLDAGSCPATSSMGSANNTFIGYKADKSANGSASYTNNIALGSQAMESNTASYNIAVGSQAFANNTYASMNIAIGYQALFTQSFSNSNVSYNTDNIAIGYQALFSNNGLRGSENTAIGDYALYSNTVGEGNTALGYVAGRNTTGNGLYNTFLGAFSGNMNTVGDENTFVGLGCGEGNTTGNYNTFVGGDAGLNNAASTGNSFFGMESGMKNTTGDYNTFNGIYSGWNNRSGSYNTFSGAFAVSGNWVDGSYNDAHGFYSLYSLSTGDSNVGMGANSLYNTSTGSANVAMGYNAGYSATTDKDNLFLGTGADRGASVINNAAAIGYNTVVTASNQMELGNNSQAITIGMSGYAPTSPVTRLEINTQQGVSPFNVNFSSTPPSYINSGKGTGWSGLRFDDLRATSTPGKNPGPGYLSLDSAGNVIYVDTAVSASGGSGIGFGLCTGTGSLPNLTGDAGVNLNNYNLSLAGNGSGNKLQNSVIIGQGCGIPSAKLSVIQSSGDINSVGLSVVNTDRSNGSFTIERPLVGIESSIPTAPCNTFYNVAAWFQAPASCPQNPQYSIFVPNNGGNVAIGFPFTGHYNNPTNLVSINGSAIDLGGWHIYSDTNLKKDVTPFGSGIKVLRGLKTYSYKYNGVGYLDTTGSYIGVIAQNLQRVAPYAVSPTTIEDTLTGKTSTVLTVYQDAVIYTAVNAIKQVDSTVTSNHSIDSITHVNQQKSIDSLRILRSTVDSLRNAFKNIQSCLDKLCIDNTAGTSNNNGTSSDIASITNVQDVTLSSADAPLLYQNMPNPFRTGSKINYYLPQGTSGAYIIFYDNYGNQIKQVQLSQSGNGTLNMTADNLANGVYSYSLIVNGNVIDTKRMVLEK